MPDSSYAFPANGILKKLTVEYWFHKNDVENHPNGDDIFQVKKGRNKIATIAEGDTSGKSLEYRGRQPFQTINLIRQEDTALPVMYNKKETGQYLSFRSVPIPDKSNRKNWCWVIDVAELNRVLVLLELPSYEAGTAT